MEIDGTNRTPHLKPSIESGMHLAVYRSRPEVGAIVHAHPVTATVFSSCCQPIACDLIAESYALLHRIVQAPYALMGTDELAGEVAIKASEADIILLQNHGVVALGDNLLQAFDRLELVEAAARMTLIAAQLDSAIPLRDEWKLQLDQLMGR